MVYPLSSIFYLFFVSPIADFLILPKFQGCFGRWKSDPGSDVDVSSFPKRSGDAEAHSFITENVQLGLILEQVSECGFGCVS